MDTNERLNAIANRGYEYIDTFYDKGKKNKPRKFYERVCAHHDCVTMFVPTGAGNKYCKIHAEEHHQESLERRKTSEKDINPDA